MTLHRASAAANAVTAGRRDGQRLSPTEPPRT